MMVRVAELFEEAEEHASDDASIESADGPTPSRPPGQANLGIGLRVLVIDDDAISRRVIAAMLQFTGAEVDNAASGRAGVALAKSTHYDIICMDCYMPVVSGFEATEMVRADERKNRKAPARIVAITGQAGRDTRERAITAGVDELLIKPVTRNALAAAVYQTEFV